MNSSDQKLAQTAQAEMDPQSLQILQALTSASGRELLALLLRFGMAETFVRQIKEREVVFNHPELSDPNQIDDQALIRYCQEHKIESDD